MDDVINANPDLLDILIGNLLFNAVKYTPEQGNIELILGKNKIQIQNTAKGKSLDETQLFHRFVKTRNSGQGFGLGLSIAKKIAELYQWRLIYSFENNMHTFTIYYK